MDPYGSEGRGRRRRPLLIAGVVVVLVLIAVAVAVGVYLSQRQLRGDLQSTFKARCEKFQGYDCNKLWEAFQQAYVGRDSCKVPVEAYKPFISLAHFQPMCNKMMFWSKTKGLVHDFTEKKKGCFVTLEDTLLGAVANDLTWCGKEGTNETFTTDCPPWNKCEMNPVRSFWNGASAAFGDAACGTVTVMLNGFIKDPPFDPNSIFASIEMPRFTFPKVTSLNVVLITQNNFRSCSDDSLMNLQKQLAYGIKYNCKEVSKAEIEKCSSNPEIQCDRCW